LEGSYKPPYDSFEIIPDNSTLAIAQRYTKNHKEYKVLRLYFSQIT